MKAVVVAVGVCLSVNAGAQSYLPDTALVTSAIQQRADVIAAGDRAEAAVAQARALSVGEHEAEISVIPQRRKTDYEGRFNEWEVQLGRRFRLPGKAGLDRSIGAHVRSSAAIQRRATEHDASVQLLHLWMDWLFSVAAEEQAEKQLSSVQSARTALARRAEMGDAADLDVDLLDAELALAAVVHGEHVAKREASHLALTREYPTIPLPVRPPLLPEPERLSGDAEEWVARILEHDHELLTIAEEVARHDLLAARARADRIPDPTLGVRVMDERDGAERSVGLVFSMPIGTAHRSALADSATASARAFRRDAQALRLQMEIDARVHVMNATHAVTLWHAQNRAYLAMAKAASRARKAWDLGEIDLAERLLADRREREAAMEEQRLRTEALTLGLLVRLDSHELWEARE